MPPRADTMDFPSQAEAVAAQVEAEANGTPKKASTTTTEPPCTPPHAPASPVPQESALKRLGNRLRRRIRSSSAPPAPGRRQMLEEHYRMDPITQQILPGVPQHDPNFARDMHDFFNLVVLIPLCALNAMNWNWDLIGQQLSSGNEAVTPSFEPKDAWTDEWFYPFFYVTALYFIADLLWVVLIPHCVRSPATIVQHHIATLLYISVPYFVPLTRWLMGACMSVEVNTWLLIARRVFNKQGFPPWTIMNWKNYGISIRIKLISIFFYTTWISIRCLLYPYLLPHIWASYLIHSGIVGTHWNLMTICFPLHAVFCILNLKWSYDLLMSKIRYWKKLYNQRKNGGQQDDDGEDNEKDKGL